MVTSKFNRIIVSRHPAAVEFIARQMDTDPSRYTYVCEWRWGSGACTTDPTKVAGLVKQYGAPIQVPHVIIDTLTPDDRADYERHATEGGDEYQGGYERVPVLTEATPEDVRGKVVYGNLPLHLAALADAVYAIEFHVRKCARCNGCGRWVVKNGACEEEDEYDGCNACNGTGHDPKSGRPPRGAEYTLADMMSAGAELVKYGVLCLPDDQSMGDYLSSGGFAL